MFSGAMSCRYIGTIDGVTVKNPIGSVEVDAVVWAVPWSVEAREGDWTVVGMVNATHASPYYGGSQIDLPTSGADHGREKMVGKVVGKGVVL